MTARTRLPTKERETLILNAGLKVAAKKGWVNLDPGEVAKAAGCSRSLILKIFSSTQLFRLAVLDAGIEQTCLRVIAQGLAVRNRKCLRLSDDIKAQAIASLNS